MTPDNKTKNNEKIGKVLKKLLDPKFKIRNDVYLSQFLTHLAGKNDEKTSQNQNNELQEQFCQWIIDACTLWEKQTENPKPAILAFALNLASQLSADEQVFVKLNCQNVYESLVAVVQSCSPIDPTVTLGLVTLLCSFVEHKSGLQWVMATTHWADMINLGLKAHTLYVRKKAYYFVQKLLEKTIGFNRNFSSHIVRILIKPLRDGLRSLPSSGNQRSLVDNRDLYESLKPSLDFILEVTDPLLRNFNRSVLQLFIEQDVPTIIDKYLLISRNEDFSFQLLQIQFVFLFHKLSGKVAGVKAVAHDSVTLFDCKLMFDLIKNEMDKNYVRCVIKICNYSHDLFCCLSPRMPIFIKKDHTIEFQIQVIFLQITPVFVFSIQLLTRRRIIKDWLNDVFKMDFRRKMLKKIDAERISYKWAEKLKDKPDLIDDVVFCFQYIGKMKKLLNKERAAIIFPALVYSFCDALTTIREGPRVEMSSSCKQYFKALVETIVDLVESFDLTWKDSIETICVMDCAYDFLELPYWTNENIIIQRGLKLLKTTISKYMSPDMALLIYNKEDSKISQIGSLVYAKCHDSCWEIRDSALEVVHTLSFNANTKFPAYTHVLLNAELPQLVVEMAFKDGEYYVRATAFKCLQELIQIQEVWSIILEKDNKFLDHLLGVFENETEAIVRKEAASLIHKIAKYQSFPEEILPRLYDVMTHATIGDLHWEVKYTALDFWFNKWDEHLIEQGMIDRAFPSHTFSKQLKKIVALTPNVVNQRLIKVLNQLAHIGCLHVMKCAVKDDCDFEVSKKATEFTFIMLRMFKAYQVPRDNIDLSQPPSPMIQPNPIAPIIPSQPQTKQINSTNEDSSSNSITHGESDHANFENLGSLQFSNSPFFDPVSPFNPNPYSPSLDLITLPSLTTSELTLQPPSDPPTQNGSPLQNQTSYGNTEYQQPQNCSPVKNQSPYDNSGNADSQTSPTSSVQSSTQLSGSGYQTSPSSPWHSVSTSNPSANPVTDVDTFGIDGASFDCSQLERVVNSTILDPVQQDRMLEEFLNSNDVTLLQGIYNPTEKVTNNTTQMKTKTYLAPSQFMKFVYDELEAYATQKAQWMDKLDEFDSLLDDILQEYNTENVNVMDCY